MSETGPSLENTTFSAANGSGSSSSDATTENGHVTLVLFDCCQLIKVDDDEDDENGSTMQPEIDTAIFQLRLLFPIATLYRFSCVPRNWMLFIAEQVIGMPGTLHHPYHDRNSELEDGDVYVFEVAGSKGQDTVSSIFKL